MINKPLVSGAQSLVEDSNRPETSVPRVFTPTSIATGLMSVAIAALALTRLAEPNKAPIAQSAHVEQAALPELPLSDSLDSSDVGLSAFGYLVFENNPVSGVPGFGPLPPRSSAR
jgi:hypothetical protein